MRKYKFEKYKSEIKENYFKYFAELEPIKTVSRRPRKEEDLAFLIEMSKRRYEDWVKTGRLKIIGERKYKIEI